MTAPRTRARPRRRERDRTAGRLMGLGAAAEYLGVSAWTLREMVWRGDLPKVGLPGVRRLLLDRTDLDAMILRGKGAAPMPQKG